MPTTPSLSFSTPLQDGYHAEIQCTYQKNTLILLFHLWGTLLPYFKALDELDQQLTHEDIVPTDIGVGVQEFLQTACMIDINSLIEIMGACDYQGDIESFLNETLRAGGAVTITIRNSEGQATRCTSYHLFKGEWRLIPHLNAYHIPLNIGLVFIDDMLYIDPNNSYGKLCALVSTHLLGQARWGALPCFNHSNVLDWQMALFDYELSIPIGDTATMLCTNGYALSLANPKFTLPYGNKTQPYNPQLEHFLSHFDMSQNRLKQRSPAKVMMH